MTAEEKQLASSPESVDTLTYAASLALTYEAGNVNLCRGLCKREMVRSESYLGILSEHLSCEGLKNALEVSHCYTLINNKSLKLMEHGGVRCVHLVRAVNSSGADNSYGRRSLLHRSYLNGRGLRS